MQRLSWGMSDIRIVGWGYGGVASPKALIAPEALDQVFVFRSETGTTALWRSFRVRYNARTEEITIVPGAFTDMENELMVP